MKPNAELLPKEIIKEPVTVHKQKVCNFTGPTANLHSHSYIEILYTLGGRFNIWLDGKYFEFAKGDMVIINSQEVHCINSVEAVGDGGYICLRFTPDILYGSTQKILELKYVLPFLTNHNPPQKVFTAAEIKDTDIPKLMHEIYDEYDKQEYAFELAMRANIFRIFLWILRYWKNAGLDAEDKINLDLAKKLQPVIDYISMHYSEPLTAEAMAEYANLSYSYFSRSFKQLTERGFSEYLNFIRITESEKLLLTTDMNITEIALSVGFSTSSYYIQQFKLYKNVSPKRFKKTFFS
ncbi:MAG: helix-turn-helix transcriptional regulator [Clostridia bacterium]|nr:helix-turn-helix transcriptional regulator [Clostridia bacterium]